MIYDQIITGKVCPYCNKGTVYVDSGEIYGKSYGMIYLCRPCRAYCGVHKGTDKSLGRIANTELRELKKQAHASFDRMWNNKGMGRNQAYKWLSKRMNLPPHLTHIGMFDCDQCKIVIEISNNELNKQNK